MKHRYVIRGTSKFGDINLCTFITEDSYEEIEPQLIEVYRGEPGEELFKKAYMVGEQLSEVKNG